METTSGLKQMEATLSVVCDHTSAMKAKLDDLLFRALIVKFCADRQLAIDEGVVGYLTTRIERSYAAARQAVDQLDREALRLGRPVTRALAAELLRKA